LQSCKGRKSVAEHIHKGEIQSNSKEEKKRKVKKEESGSKEVENWRISLV